MNVTPIDPSLPPEVAAYALGKFSRSDKPFAANLAACTEENSSAFIDKFVLGYGHSSLKDLAQVSFAVEDLSILAATDVLDESLWSGQERSTRYQNYGDARYYMPDTFSYDPDDSASAAFRHTLAKLTSAYNDTLSVMTGATKTQLGRALTAAEKARIFDVARALLPLGTITALGQVTSARTLERQIARLSLHELPEVRAAGQALRAAAAVHVPTLLKRPEPSTWQREWPQRARELAADLLAEQPISLRKPVEVSLSNSGELDAVASLLYRYSNYGHSFRDCCLAALDMATEGRAAFLDVIFAGRGPHDDWPRELQGGPIVVDFTADFGSYRDIHRHRRCTQIRQEFGSWHEPVNATAWLRQGLDESFLSPIMRWEYVTGSCRNGLTSAVSIANELIEYSPEAAYLYPLGTQIKFLIKADLAELVYLCELRSKPGGHFAYRALARELSRQLAGRYPHLWKHTNVNQEVGVDFSTR